MRKKIKHRKDSPVQPGAKLPPAAAQSSANSKFKNIEEIIRGQIARAIGSAPEDLDEEATLASVGFDSIEAVELKNVICNELGTDIPFAELFSAKSIAGISRRVASSLRDAANEPPPDAGNMPNQPTGSKISWDEGVL